MSTTDPHTLSRLRFLAEAAITALSDVDQQHGKDLIPDDAAEQMLRALLERAVPVLRASVHQLLADQIEAILAEPTDRPQGSTVLRSDVLILAVGIAVSASVVSLFLTLPDLLAFDEILIRLPLLAPKSTQA